jgi:hypothetical protein
MSNTSTGRRRLWSEAVLTDNKRFGTRQYEIRAQGPGRTFEDFTKQCDDIVITFFRDLCNELASGEQHDYHMKIANRFDHKLRRPLDGWEIIGFYDTEDTAPRAGPLKVERCMSCDIDCPLSIGVLGSEDKLPGGPTSRDSWLRDSEYMRTWFDAKARPMVIVTPKVRRPFIQAIYP